MHRRVFLLVFCLSISVCNATRQGRIVGGDIINIEQAPFNVALEYLTRQICGGAILTDRWVVTAAHCFGRIFLASQALVRIGSGLRLQGGTAHSVVTYIQHPAFVLKVNDHDVALVKVYPAIKYSTVATPIQLPDYWSSPPPGTMMTVYGWGYTKESGDPSDYLRAVSLPVFPHEECVTLYRTTLNVTSQMLCAGYRSGGKDACVLDSGGPMVWGGVLRGLVSWGYGCARVLRPGVFTDLSAPSVKDWILRNLQT